MKEALYSLEDREYCFLVQRIGDIFRKLKVNYAVVGGTAAQLRTVGMICGQEGKPLEDLILTEEVSERQNLRRTNDVDLITGNYEDPLELVEALEGEESTDNDVFEVKLERKGMKRPIYVVSSLNGNARVSLNVSHSEGDMERLKPENYNVFLEQARDVEFDYEELHPIIRVLKPEHIIAAKLTRNSAKDQFDILTLADLSLKYGVHLDVGDIGKAMGVPQEPINGVVNGQVPIEIPCEYFDRFHIFKMAYENRKANSKAE